MSATFTKIYRGVYFRPQLTLPTNPQDGDLVFDGNDNKFKLYVVDTWETLSFA